MTCAFLGNPRPTVTLYKGEVNITANSKFWYNSTSGVCTLVIPTCTLKDSGEYSVLVENELGKDRSSCTLTVYGEGAMAWGQEAGCIPSGAEAQSGVLWAVDSLCMAGNFYLICHQVAYTLSILNVICYVPGPCRCGGLQALGGLWFAIFAGPRLALKKTPVIRPKPDSPTTISLAGSWKES